MNIPKGSFAAVKTAGIEQLRNDVVNVLPELIKSVSALQDWSQTSLLSIWMGRLHRWHRDGLLFIGDAAHVMTPAFGFGINLAIQDAVVAADVLVPALRNNARTGAPISERTLRQVQRRRVLPTAAIQGIQRGMDGRQRHTGADGPPQRSIPMRRLMNAPIARHLIAHLLGVGMWRVRVRSH